MTLNWKSKVKKRSNGTGHSLGGSILCMMWVPLQFQLYHIICSVNSVNNGRMSAQPGRFAFKCINASVMYWTANKIQQCAQRRNERRKRNRPIRYSRIYIYIVCLAVIKELPCTNIQAFEFSWFPSVPLLKIRTHAMALLMRFSIFFSEWKNHKLFFVNSKRIRFEYRFVALYFA